jgi:two-component system, LuxR family, sensor kinase FixL
MLKTGNLVARGLTLRYLFALGLVAALAIANFVVLRAEIRANESSVELLTLSGRQRTLLQSTALLAQGLVSIYSPDERAPLRAELLSAIDSLDTAHHRLVEFDPMGAGSPPPEVQVIYESTPWLLDTEIRNYLTHLRELARIDDEELTFLNPHYRYIRQVALKGEVMDGLDAVVAAYQEQSEQRAAQLSRLAQSSLTSTLVVLALTGLFVLRPMVRRVRHDMAALQDLNETLEQRVAERTAVAEQRARDLAASEALYHSLVENLPMGVARRDLEGRFTYVNELFCQLTGRRSESVLGATALEVFPPRIALRSHQDHARVIEAGTVIQWVQQQATPAGENRSLELLQAPVLDVHDRVTGTQTVIWDVSERKAAEERVLHAERLAAVGEMVTGVAHESRNALQQIGACAKMLEWEVNGDGEARGLIADVQKAHDRLHRLFENLRGYVSPLRLETRVSNLVDVFQEAWATTANLRAGRDISLVQQVGEIDPRWMIDPFQMEQVFRNILENALAACHDPVRIRVDWNQSVRDEKPTLRITVADNGPGLSADAAVRIFDPFFTTRSRGTGLGMAIVRRIVEAHGGWIEAGRPVEGIGTEVRITLPKGES